MIRVDPWAYVFGAVLVLMLPLDWLLAALGAAAFHEVCHMIAISFLGGRVMEIRVGIGGAVMETELSGKARELLCALAGPVGSFFLIFACHLFPKLAICGGIQGMFNLLPVYPLDGGRALRCGLELLWPEKAGKVENWVEFSALLGLAFLAVAGTFVFSLGVMPLIVALMLILKAILRKSPCKRSQIGVQ